jgi:CMP-N,N'-diacetyllegionaminic acid synthase
MHIGIIPARGGSKRVPGKNIRLIAGKPLLAWTAEAARASRLDRIILSTDSEDIARVGCDCGLEVPFLRPALLAEDTTPMLPVLRQFVDWLEQAETRLSSIVLLQPTSPLRLPEHIDQSLDLFESRQPESVVSVTDVPPAFGSNKFMKLAADGAVTKVSVAPTDEFVVRNGPAIVVTAPHVIKADELYGNPTLGYRMERRYSLDIDDEDDFLFAEQMLMGRQAMGSR